ncbi:hypothetical protein RND81_03G091600 [Saponaria officinalis]|uniref:Nuclear condensin complex subunit 3 C-terminal domain-containing protein n=1 Tax=Saponaria officinalis TaxID=3572 RepID=A0AAW1M6E9_SAPOF
MAEIEQTKQLTLKIATIFEESRASYASHNRKLKELSKLRSTSPNNFFSCFCKALSPLFLFQRRTPSAERVVRFVSTFACFTDSNSSVVVDHSFLEDFLLFLLSAVTSANKTARFRSCQIISDVIMRLPDDAEVSSELWDQVIDSMMLRVGDKIPIVRTFAIRALSRFVNDLDNSDILELFIETLDSEQNADVRKTIVLSLPPSNATSSVIIGCTLDVSESVRKAAYLVLANKFPLQSLSIKLRTLILQRGLSDRSPSIVKECLKLLKDEWLSKSCNGDPIELLKYLDVETYESVGVSVMRALLEAGMVKLDGSQGMQQFKDSSSSGVGDCSSPRFELLEPEISLYWRVVCQYLHSKAQAKGSDAAATTGAEAAVYAAEASDSNDLLENVLPATVSDYVEFVQAHITAGPNYRFTSRQLLLLGALLDFSDATIRKIANKFVLDLLRQQPEYETDGDENKLVIGDGMNLGGDRDWASALAGLTKKVNAADGEFEEVILSVVEELARSCRERTADFIGWLHCLAVVGFVLENTKSLYWLRGKAFEATEILNSLLLPGAKHINLDVQRAAIRCLGLYGLLERKPGEDVVKQLLYSFAKGPCPISLLAGKALIDLVMWHGPQEVDAVIGQDFYAESDLNGLLSGKTDDGDVGILNLLYAGLENDVFEKAVDVEGNESVQAALGEGFAKILLLSENYPSIPSFLHSLTLTKLIALYFSTESNELQRLKQCLSVFFEHYSSLSANHKKYLSKAFIPVMQAMWPGINGSNGGSTTMISNMRKRAVQASRFMLQMVQSTLYQKEADCHANGQQENNGNSVDECDDFETTEEGLALRIATEITRFPSKKTAAEKSYISALCKTMVLVQFRASEQEAIKLMRYLINHVAESVSYEKELVKELASMAKNLKSLDINPEEELSKDRAKQILERLGVEYNVDEGLSKEIPPTPASRMSQPARSRRRARREESSSDEEGSPMSVVPAVVMSSTRSQRASKTAALTKITASSAARAARVDDIEEDEEEDSDLTSEDEPDDSDLLTQ